MGLLRRNATQAELRIKLHAQDVRSIYLLPGIQAEPIFLSQESHLFDPRTRPWYRLAQGVAGHIWTPVYIDFNAKDLVMTRARQVFGRDGQPVGVVATDVSLKELRLFVDGLHLSEGAQAFLMEPNGDLVAGTGMDNIRQSGEQPPSRVNAASAGNPLLKAVYRQLVNEFSQSNEVARTALIFDAKDHAIEVAYRRVTDEAGLNWLAVVAVPHQQMLAGIRVHVVLVVALGLLALGSALALGLRIFGGLAKDMRSLTYAVRRVGQGEIDVPIGVERNDEIGELANNVHHMRHRLFTDALTGAANRSALNHILETLTRPGSGKPAVFAILFIDLNQFKPLNDRWGHDNGDLALVEVVQRLKEVLRSNDVLIRLGGDEFVAVLQGVHSDAQIQVVKAKILEALAPALQTLKGLPEGVVVHLGASIGQAIFPADGADPQSLLKHADLDMYKNKQRSGHSR